MVRKSDRGEDTCMQRSRLFQLSLALLTILVLGGALAQRKVAVLCSVALPWCEALGPAFRQATGIELSFVRLPSEEALARLQTDPSKPVFDVWFGGDSNSHYQAFKNAYTQFYRPKAYKDLRQEAKNAIGPTFIPLYQEVLGIGINRDALTKKNAPIPQCWKDLANPAYRGLIQVANPGTSGTAYTFLATLVQLFGEDDTFKFLAAMHKNVSAYTYSGVAPRTALSRGVAGIGILFMQDMVEYQKQGYPIEIISPCEGTGYAVGGLSLVYKAPHPLEALEFINWAVTPEAQVLAFKAGFFALPSNTATPLAPGVPNPQGFKLIEFDAKKFASPEVKGRLIERWTKRIFSLPR